MRRMFTTFMLFAVLCGFPPGSSGAQDSHFEASIWKAWQAGFAARFPGKTWQKFQSPEEAGWSSEKLAAVRELSETMGWAAVLIVYDGIVLAEWGEVERRFMCHSMRKSILSAMYGIAVNDGQIQLDENLKTLGIDDDTPLTPEEKTATISDLLKARSGVYLPAAYESPAMRRARPKRGSHPPGSFWHYNNWDFNTLATIYNRKTKGDLFKTFKARIADPLQMQDFDLRHTYYHLEAHHSRHAAYPFRMSARDLARFGLLFLNEGMWRGERIVSPDWVRLSTKSHSLAYSGRYGYGYMWWRHRGLQKELGTYSAAGYGGHRIYVVPAARLVVVHRADTYTDGHLGGTYSEILLRDTLLARTGPVRQNPKIVARMQQTNPQAFTPPPESEVAELIGHYSSENFPITVERRPGGLLANSPVFGRFYLHRLEARKYLVEDARYELHFARAPKTGLTLIRSHKKPLEMRIVR